MHRHSFTRWIRLTYYFSPTAPTTKCPTSCCHSALFFKRNFFYISTLPHPSPRPPTTTGSEISSSRIVRQSIEVRRGFSHGEPLHLTLALQRVRCIHRVCTKQYIRGTWLDNGAYIAQIIALINHCDNNICVEYRQSSISVVKYIYRESAIRLKLTRCYFLR